MLTRFTDRLFAAFCALALLSFGATSFALAQDEEPESEAAISDEPADAPLPGDAEPADEPEVKEEMEELEAVETTPANEDDAPEEMNETEVEGVAEMAEEDAKAEAAAGERPPRATTPEGMLNQAFELSKTVATLDDATYMIELCEEAMLGKIKPQFVDYAKQLTAWAYNKRGELSAEAGDSDAALADFERSISLDSARWKAIHNRAVSLAMMGRYDQALLDFDRTIQLKPNYANAYYNRGELRYDQGDYQRAVDDYSSAIRFSPRDSEAYNSRGHAWYKLGRLQQAIGDYDRALQLDAENAAAYVNRGDAFTEMGQYGRAAQDYKNAIRIAPNLGRAYQSAAWLMSTAPDDRIRHGQYALDAAQKAIELDGESYRYLDTLAAAYANAGRYADAREAEQKAIEAAPPDVADAYQARLAKYQNDQPHRDAPTSRGVTTARGGIGRRGR